jgi:hypothetical protein
MMTEPSRFWRQVIFLLLIPYFFWDSFTGRGKKTSRPVGRGLRKES